MNALNREYLVPSFLFTLIFLFSTSLRTVTAFQDTNSTLLIVNNSEHTICSLHVSSVTDSDWGIDWLNGNTIPPETSYSFDLPPGGYSVRLEDCSGEVLLLMYNFTISGSYELLYEPNSTLRVNNNSDHAICYVYITHYHTPFWGSNWLSVNNRIAPGSVYSFDLSEGYYDLRLEGCERESLIVHHNLRISGLFELRISTEVSGLLAEAQTLFSEGEHLLSTYQFESALSKLEEALALYQGANNDEGEAICLTLIGTAKYKLGDFYGAQEAYRGSLHIFQTLDDQIEVAAALTAIGSTYIGLAQYEQALIYFQQSLGCVDILSEPDKG